MTDTDPVKSPDPERSRSIRSPAWRTAGSEPSQGPSPESGTSLLAHLQSLKELQIILSQDGSDEGILRDGTVGTVEIVGADCAIALLDTSGASPAMRFGWNEGRHMAAHEIEIVSRQMEGALSRPQQVIDPGGDAPAAGSARRFGSILVQDIGAGVGRRGVLMLARHDPVAFSREQALLAEILCAQMSIQIDRARRSAEARGASERLREEIESSTRGLQERNQELAALHAIAAAASPSLDPGKQMEVALREATRATRHAAGAIFLAQEEAGGEVLKLARAFGNVVHLDLTRSRSGGAAEGVAARAWESGQPVVIHDLSAERKTEELEALHSAGHRALLCVPLRARGRVVGALELLADEDRRYAAWEIDLAQAVGDQIALVLQNTRLLSDVMSYSLDLEARVGKQAQDLARREQESRALRSIATAAGRSNDLRDLLESALGRVVELLGMEAGAAHLIDPRTRSLQLRVQKGLPPEALDRLGSPHARSIIGRAYETGQPQTAGGWTEGGPATTRSAEDGLGDSGFRLLAAIPLRSLSGVLGVLSVAGRDERAPGQEEMACLEGIGELLGTAVENARAFQDHPAAQVQDRGLPEQWVQAQKMESVGTLAGGIAHEFNNIIGTILGYSSHIKSLTTADNPIHRQASIIEQQSQRAAELTQQLLAFARGGQYALGPVDLNELIDETASFLSKSLNPAIALEVHTDPDLPAVEADAGQMKQVLLNVAVNAADALPEGGRITFETRVAHLDEQYVRSRPELAAGDYVEVVVGDTGAGMPPGVVERAFEPFFTTKTGQGTGLGLSVVYGIVKNHRGHVALDSTPGLGTTVRIYLPCGRRSTHRPAARAPEPAASAAAAVDPAGASSVSSWPAAGKRRILVVDDEEAIRDMMRDILGTAGYEVVVAHDGVDALEVYSREWGRISLVLLDMVMPRMGGVETFRRLLGLDRGVRVLLCSGYAENEQAQRAIREGALGFLPKPFTMSELLTRVGKVFGPDASMPH
jgi:signal transduction histidine kinase/ActR/RegA family two-component response regulator